MPTPEQLPWLWKQALALAAMALDYRGDRFEHTVGNVKLTMAGMKVCGVGGHEHRPSLTAWSHHKHTSQGVVGVVGGVAMVCTVRVMIVAGEVGGMLGMMGEAGDPELSAH